jgi:hypothetical protein
MPWLKSSFNLRFGFLCASKNIRKQFFSTNNTKSASKDNEAYYTYVKEADDVANKVSQRMRLGMTYE